ncbi:hypothetical protein Pcinc_023816 [Petrolisthes cinctipes]|uniref:Transmembrane protein 199 n=1 Tax=Petrolisthes cinctipes TaxID=88211 RepID=A0AAE1FB73_PETCI|nr:hypothetical protein Pcinc_023816 [Petrolisthes cinctipes]
MDHLAVVPSKRFVQILQELKNAIGVPDSLREQLSSYNESCEKILSLTTQEVKWCHNKMRERGIPERIHELLSESKIVLPKYEPPPRNPELEARVQRLRYEQENREYRAMTKSVDPTYNHETGGLGEIGREMRTVNKQLISGAQYILSIVGTFFGVFILLGASTQDYGVRALLATISALIVGLAEMYFIIREDLREEDRFDKLQ